MTDRDQAAFDALVRLDFPSFLHRCVRHLNPGAEFLPNWHIDAMAYRLSQIQNGEINQLIINLPPRHLKSITVSVAFAAFLLGHRPHRRIIAISYSNELSDKHSSDFRSIVRSGWYQRVFPRMRISRDVGDQVITTQRGFRKSTSVSGSLTGLGGDLFIIDDPQKPVDAQSAALRNNLNQWVANTLMSRLDNKETSAIIVVMQRVHLDDLSGFLLSGALSDWTHLSLPAISETEEQIPIGENKFYHRPIDEALHPQHESLRTLRKLQQTLGSDVFAAQYQQCPVPPGGGMIKREWLRYYSKAPERGYRTKIIQSWDTAAKDGAQNDWSVCSTWHYRVLGESSITDVGITCPMSLKTQVEHKHVRLLLSGSRPNRRRSQPRRTSSRNEHPDDLAPSLLSLVGNELADLDGRKHKG